MKQKMARYEMHKYWGKKPSKDLLHLIEKYSQVGDILLDPFAGYGVFVSEAYLNGRNAIGNDLNPSSTFIQKQLLDGKVDLDLFECEIKRVLAENKDLNNKWYSAICPKCNNKSVVLSTLRSKSDFPLMNKVKCSCTKSAFEYELSEIEAGHILDLEDSLVLNEHPTAPLIRNGRISAFDNMTTDDLFTKRALHCHAGLWKSIDSIKDSATRDLAKFAFTSNIANCSRLVPPIKSRGPMAPGAWMTGFYVGETYLENNVYHYFKNRVAKIISGKKDFFDQNSRLDNLVDKGQVEDISSFNSESRGYLITNYDTKNLNFPDNSIDYIFTDPPYGDSVPYFEQSAIWNTWLGFTVDYDNEVVISDSKSRQKRPENFASEISHCVHEIYRVLKSDSYFSITFHSISGSEWYALTKACLEAGFLLDDIQWLTQKTFAPRQLNRKKTVKGDVLITFKKSINQPKTRRLNKLETEDLIRSEADRALKIKRCNTNDIYMTILNKVFSEHIVIAEVNFIDVLMSYYVIDSDGFWRADHNAA